MFFSYQAMYACKSTLPPYLELHLDKFGTVKSVHFIHAADKTPKVGAGILEVQGPEKFC